MQRPALHAQQLLGGALAAFGALVVVRWVFDVDAIARLVPGSVEMGLNAPLLFVAAGLCCAAIPDVAQRHRAVKGLVFGCIALLVVLPLLVLGEHLLNLNLGIDFVRHPVAPSEVTPHPGRMAPNTALGFLAAGIACWLAIGRPSSRRGWPLTLAVSVVAAVGLAGFIGHVLRLEGLYRLASFNRMVAPTAAALSVLALALWLLRERVQSEGGHVFVPHMTRITYRAVTVLTLVALAAGTAALAVLRDTFERDASDMLSLTAATNATALVHALDVGLWMPRTVATRQRVQQAMGVLADNPQDAAARALLREEAGNAMSTGIAGISFFDARGGLLQANGESLDLGGLASMTLRAQRQEAQLLWRKDGHLLVADAEIDAGERTVGRVRLQQRLSVVDALLNAVRNSGEGNDAVLCSREGKDIVVCAPSRFYPEPLRIPMFDEHGAPKLPVNRALLGETGVTMATDLRHVKVLVAYTPVAATGLALVVKSDAESVYAPLKKRINIVIAAFIALVALGTYALRLSVRPLLAQILDEQRRTRVITDNVPALISHFDRQGRIDFANAPCADAYGVPLESFMGKTLLEVRGEADYALAKPHVERVLAGERVEFESTLQRRGRLRCFKQCYVPDVDAHGQVQGFYSVSFDITELKNVQQQLSQLARFDTLTGLPNRHQFNERLNEALARSARSRDALALMYLDVDRFKGINDSLGHAAGDAVLQEFARRLQACVRSTDTVARLAGDEFVVILEALHEEDEAQAVARKIVAQVQEPFDIWGRLLDISTSIGVAFQRGDGGGAALLLQRADAALYEAKALGRNRFAMAVV